MSERERWRLSLDGDWRFRMDPDGTIAQEALADAPIFWRKTTVPGDLAHACPEEPDYEGRCCFAREFSLPRETEGRRLVLRFEAVNYAAAVYLNGTYVGGSAQGFLPFECEIGAQAVFGKPNRLLVLTDSRREDGELPSVFYWRNAGGIVRGVSVYATPPCHLARVSADGTPEGLTRLKAVLGGTVPEGAALSVELFGPEGGRAAVRTLPAAAEISCEIPVEEPALWSPDSPALYRAVFTLETEAGTDQLETAYGYRRIEARDGKILLNGEPIFLKGFDRHEDHPACGGAADRAAVDADFARIKDSGANFVRMCHYPHDPYELRRADELGLILLAEIPLNAWLIPWGVPETVQGKRLGQTYENAKEMLRRMIERDRSHPSVCFWSVSNETNEALPEVTAVNDALLQYARLLDPSRLCVHVSMLPFRENGRAGVCFRYDDVICVNLYPSASGRIRRNGDYDLAESALSLRETVGELSALYPGKPVLVTEFGYPTGLLTDGVRDEAFQAECVAAEYPVLREIAAGAALWVFADHLWPRRNREGREISPYGALRRDRVPRPLWAVYSALMRADETPKEEETR